MTDKFNSYGLIFVGGAPRSGTTLVQRILDAHSLVYGGPEFDLVPEIMRLRSRFLQGIELGRISAYLDRNDVDTVFEKFLASLFQKKINVTGKRFLSEKTPANLGAFSDLQQCLPNSRYIFVMRDPRSIVASMLEVGRRYLADRKIPPAYTRSSRRAVEYINSLWENGNQARLKGDNVFVVYYEDLVHNPRAVIEALADFIGIPFEEGQLAIQNSSWDMPEFKSGEAYWYTKDQLSTPIKKEATEKWSTVLTGYDLYLIDKLLLRRPGLTDRYQLEVSSKFWWPVCNYLGEQWAAVRNRLITVFAKLSKVL
ncbi:MAG: sulfotransferase family protein [Methylosarcina sp.]